MIMSGLDVCTFVKKGKRERIILKKQDISVSQEKNLLGLAHEFRAPKISKMKN